MDKRQFIKNITLTTDCSESEAGYLYDDLLLTELSPADIGQQIDSITDRLIHHTPLQYISGLAHFYGYTYLVNDAVLIPRPETEELVHKVEKHMKDRGDSSLLDIGTGSGCIPITAALRCRRLQAAGLDVSEAALEVARANASRHQVDMDLIQVDFTDAECWSVLDTYDIITSNPPYIPTAEKSLMAPRVLDHEPFIALFVEDTDPLLFYKLIAIFGKSHLSTDGMIVLELNEYNAASVYQLYVAHGYSSVELHKDLQGKDRILSCRL